MSPGDAMAALAWLVEMGADEIVGEPPVNRFCWRLVAPPVYRDARRQGCARPVAAAVDRQTPATRCG